MIRLWPLRSEVRIGRTIRGHKKATDMEITSRYNQGLQKSKTLPTLKQCVDTRRVATLIGTLHQQDRVAASSQYTTTEGTRSVDPTLDSRLISPHLRESTFSVSLNNLDFCPHTASFHCKLGAEQRDEERDPPSLLLQTAIVWDTSRTNWQLQFRQLLFCFCAAFEQCQRFAASKEKAAVTQFVFARVTFPRSAVTSHIFIFPAFQKVPSHMFCLNVHTHKDTQNIKRHRAVSKPTSASVTERVWCRGSVPLCTANDVARACRVGVERIWKWNCDIRCDNFTATQFPAGRRDLPGSLKWLFVYRATSSRPAIYFFFFGGFRQRLMVPLTGVPLWQQTPVCRQQTQKGLGLPQRLQTGYTTSEEKWKPRDAEDTLAFLVCTREGVMEVHCRLYCYHQCVWSTHTSSF